MLKLNFLAEAAKAEVCTVAGPQKVFKATTHQLTGSPVHCRPDLVGAKCAQLQRTNESFPRQTILRMPGCHCPSTVQSLLHKFDLKRNWGIGNCTQGESCGRKLPYSRLRWLRGNLHCVWRAWLWDNCIGYGLTKIIGKQMLLHISELSCICGKGDIPCQASSRHPLAVQANDIWHAGEFWGQSHGMAEYPQIPSTEQPC